MKKRIAVVLVVALLGVGAFFAIEWLNGSHEPGATLRLYGNIEERDAQLAFFGQEQIAEVLVDEGDRVDNGQLLATLRTDRLQAEIAGTQARIAAQQARVDELENGARPQEVAEAQAQVAAAQTRVENADQAIARVRTTSQSGASSAQDLDDAQAALDVARAELEVRQQTLALVQEGPREEQRRQAKATLDALQADLTLLQRRLADSELHAPSAGTVRNRILEPGEIASPERPVLTLALTDPKWARVWLPEPELGRVAPGMPARVRTDAFGGRSYPGHVGFLSPTAEFTPKTVETEELRTSLVYEVRVLVDDPDDELRLGMPVTVVLGAPAREKDAR